MHLSSPVLLGASIQFIFIINMFSAWCDGWCYDDMIVFRYAVIVVLVGKRATNVFVFCLSQKLQAINFEGASNTRNTKAKI